MIRHHYAALLAAAAEYCHCYATPVTPSSTLRYAIAATPRLIDTPYCHAMLLAAAIYGALPSGRRRQTTEYGKWHLPRRHHRHRHPRHACRRLSRRPPPPRRQPATPPIPPPPRTMGIAAASHVIVLPPPPAGRHYAIRRHTELRH